LETGYHLALLFMRCILGAVMFAHGAQKVLGWFGGQGLQRGAESFKRNWNIPRELFLLSTYSEFICGIVLVAGIFSRMAAVITGINMLVATLKAQYRHGFFLRSVDGRAVGMEFTLTLFFISLAVACAGGGALSLDALLGV
jgi:putative oxidoreductase